MVQFFAGVFVSVLFLLSALIGYIAGQTNKVKPNIAKKTHKIIDDIDESPKKREITDDEEWQQKQIEEYRRDFNEMMGYNQYKAVQPRREMVTK
jgi:hypothetical protein